MRGQTSGRHSHKSHPVCRLHHSHRSDFARQAGDIETCRPRTLPSPDSFVLLSHIPRKCTDRERYSNAHTRSREGQRHLRRPQRRASVVHYSLRPRRGPIFAMENVHSHYINASTKNPTPVWTTTQPAATFGDEMYRIATRQRSRSAPYNYSSRTICFWY